MTQPGFVDTESPEAHAKGRIGLCKRAGAGVVWWVIPAPTPQPAVRRWGTERERVGKLGRGLIGSQGRCSDSVTPSWKESVSVLNLVASYFQDVAGSLALSRACLFTRFLSSGTEGCEEITQVGHKEKPKAQQKASRMLLTHNFPWKLESIFIAYNN